uniref:Alpha-carbonic anhydrase domain-containing protein n=1 Tax=Ditylum brightwellii TaxID=49249 RepID=A0A7S4RT30_9STRA
MTMENITQRLNETETEEIKEDWEQKVDWGKKKKEEERMKRREERVKRRKEERMKRRKEEKKKKKKGRQLQIKEGYNSSDPLTPPGRWDPWHGTHIKRSIWFYAYKGSLTEPPCTPFVQWRIMDTPMLLSIEQIIQLKRILFNHVDEKCRPTSVHSNGSVARPIQQNITHDVHRCTCHHFTSDELKAKGIHKCTKKFNYAMDVV